MILGAPGPEHIDVMVELGRRDAEAWAREQGLLPPLPAGHVQPEIQLPPAPAPAPRPSLLQLARPLLRFGGTAGAQP